MDVQLLGRIPAARPPLRRSRWRPGRSAQVMAGIAWQLARQWMPARGSKPLNRDGGMAMATKVGDQIVVTSDKVGIPERRGEILEVIAHQTSVEYRVRWEDGH